MIRFACPGCSSTFTVADEKAGKTGKCPKCQIQFTIPQRYEAGSDQLPPMTTVEAPPPIPTVEAPRAEPVRSVEAPPPMPPPVESDEPVEIAACPKCASRLSVLPGDIGLDVECPNCKTVYRATRTGAAPVLERSMARPKSSSLVVKQKRDEDDEDDERPSRRKKSRRGDDDEDEYRPRKKSKKRRRSNVESKRIIAGVLALLLGGFGAHKFVLGYTNSAVIMLVTSLVGVMGFFGGFCCTLSLVLCLGNIAMSIIGIIEGIMYLTKSDAEFIETYQFDRKEWF